MVERLTYSRLDDLELASWGGSTRDLPRSDFVVGSLGPVIQLIRSPASTMIAEASLLELGRFEGAAAFISNPNGLFLDSSGCLGIAHVLIDDDEPGLELMQRALLACHRSPFPRGAAAQAVSALGELASNILEHSSDHRHGIIAYEVCEHFLGIYASDLGQGVLGTLKRNPAYSYLDDEGEALGLALQEGVSSSTVAGRGMGFRPIFVGLASLCALLRFRSGDALLEINGFGGGRPTQEVKERNSTSGFHAFVHCTFS